MKIKTLAFSLGLAAILSVPLQQSFADEAAGKATAFEKTFIKKAADGGMTEVKLGEVAQQNGGSDAVKDFGKQMVDDHTKINDNLKEVAGKMNVAVPTAVSAKHQATIEKLSAMHGAAFDKAYVMEMVKDHKKDIGEFEMAKDKVKNEDLKDFIEKSTETMKDHLQKIEKFDQAKGMSQENK